MSLVPPSDLKFRLNVMQSQLFKVFLGQRIFKVDEKKAEASDETRRSLLTCRLYPGLR
jgi:hypothetical protein